MLSYIIIIVSLLAHSGLALSLTYNKFFIDIIFSLFMSACIISLLARSCSRIQKEVAPAVCEMFYLFQWNNKIMEILNFKDISVCSHNVYM